MTTGLSRLSPPLVVALVSALLAVSLLQWRHASAREYLRLVITTNEQMQEARLRVTRAYLVARQAREGNATFDSADAAEQVELAALSVGAWLSRRELREPRFWRIRRDPELRRLVRAYAADIAAFQQQVRDPQATDVDVRAAFAALEREADAISFRLREVRANTIRREERDHAITVFLLVLFMLLTGFALHEVGSRRNEARGALEESEARLRLLMDQLPVLSWTTDRELRIRRAFGALMPLIKGLPERILGQRLEDLLTVTRDPARVMEAHRAALAGRQSGYDIDVGDLYLGVRLEPLRDHAGQIIGVVGLALDLTERRRLEEELHQAQKMEAIGRLAGGVAHDFNNLLTVIQMYAQILVESIEPGDPRRQDAQEIAATGERGARLIRQLLAVSRQQPQQRQKLDLGRVVQEMAPMMRQLAGDRIEVALDIAPDASPVMADQTQLEQVMMNLVANARDAMPGGGRISIAVVAAGPETMASVPAPAPGRYVALRISDTGKGMEAHIRERIFDPFFSTKRDGHGLGLATVYGIVQQSGGTIHVESAPGDGSTFLILLPAAGEA